MLGHIVVYISMIAAFAAGYTACFSFFLGDPVAFNRVSSCSYYDKLRDWAFEDPRVTTLALIVLALAILGTGMALL